MKLPENIFLNDDTRLTKIGNSYFQVPADTTFKEFIKGVGLAILIFGGIGFLIWLFCWPGKAEKEKYDKELERRLEEGRRNSSYIETMTPKEHWISIEDFNQMG
jgi:hypothetical protein